jgi:hypothetical protein
MSASDKSALFWNAWKLFGDDRYFDPVPEYKFAEHINYTDKSGRKRKRGYKFDWAFAKRALPVAVEVDGGQWKAHGGRHSRDSDRDKMNLAAALGWRVMRFSTQQLEADPEGCVELVIDALRYTGARIG